jgi:hypothetical protein
MFGRELNDLPPVGDEQAIHPDDHSVSSVRSCGG